jgi:hypothetical protein
VLGDVLGTEVEFAFSGFSDGVVIGGSILASAIVDGGFGVHRSTAKVPIIIAIPPQMRISLLFFNPIVRAMAAKMRAIAKKKRSMREAVRFTKPRNCRKFCANHPATAKAESPMAALMTIACFGVNRRRNICTDSWLFGRDILSSLLGGKISGMAVRF